ncbi:MAG: hypothetical protein M1818_002883 [Claussenomyces sp. TS43310]|nr:MAG: hypothetical protein M1818_002883 [Claussenomyces sp. TS43310]
MEPEKWRYGRLDAGQDSTAELQAVKVRPDQSGGGMYRRAAANDDDPQDCHDALHDSDNSSSVLSGNVSSKEGHLLSLPPELIDNICLFLSPWDLDALASTCRKLSAHAASDLCWHRHVQENVPGVVITSSFPCKTYRDLYFAHDPHWFLPKYKIWFNDYFLTGKVIIARYDPRRGCIEAYRLVAERGPPQFEHWALDDEVIIHLFSHRVQLHMDQPILHLDARSPAAIDIHMARQREETFDYETTMDVQERSSTYSNLLLARRVDAKPGMQVWPPEIIPARQRVRNASLQKFVGPGHRPQKRSEICNQAFRLRRWMNLLSPNLLQQSHGVVHHYGEEVQTFATLDPELYTPTADKPFRGIWVGDYSGHGCEFLLIHQPDSLPSVSEHVAQQEDETQEEFYNRRREERIYRGSIEAIKLTGDPNVPRGEFSFVADDIGRDGFIRMAEEEGFKGARVVASRGQVAERGFKNSKWIESQLLMISPDKLAQFWVPFGHISFFERVRIEDFLNPVGL